MEPPCFWMAQLWEGDQLECQYKDPLQCRLFYTKLDRTKHSAMVPVELTVSFLPAVPLFDASGQSFSDQLAFLETQEKDFSVYL